MSFARFSSGVWPMLLTCAAIAWGVSTPAAEAPGFAGTYATGRDAARPLKIEIVAEGEGYRGTIHLGDAALPFIARRDVGEADKLAGTFKSGDEAYEFTAKLTGTELTFATGGSTYVLTSKSNPLGAPPAATAARASANPLASGTPGPAAPPRDALVMHTKALFDPYAQMDAVRLLVPDGWEMKGAVTWIPGNAGGPLTDIAVGDPAQKAGVRFYPDLFHVDGVRENQKRANMQLDPSGRLWAKMEHFFQEGQQNTPGQEIRMLPRTPRDYVSGLLVPKYRPAIVAAKDVAVVSETDLPDYDKALTAGAINPNAKFKSSCFRITYTGPDGPVEEEFRCTICSFPVGQGPQAVTLWDGKVSSAWAPRGKLDALLPVTNAIVASAQETIEHQNFVFQIGQMILKLQREQFQQMMADNARHQQIMNDMRTQASKDLSQQIRDNFKKQQETKAAAHEQFMHYVNDTEGYKSPLDGSKVTLPANYKFSYMNNRGDVIMTSDPTFHPPVDPQTSWETMEKSR